MIRSKRILYAFSGIFLAVEMVLGILLQIREGREAAFCSYTAVVLACLFFALFFERSCSYVFTQLALILTVCADYFLVWLEAQQRLPAMIFFLFAQLAYFLRLYWEEKDAKRRQWHLILRGSVSILALLVTWIVLGERADALALISMLYYANLLMNLLWSAAKLRTHWLLALGFFLFLLCDTVIGLSLLGEYLPMAEDGWLHALLRPDFNLAWAFYLPSQVCLSLSLLPQRMNKRE